jgi:hypothetical protein
MDGAVAKIGVWDQVLAFGQYQHSTLDGKPVVTVFDATSVKCMFDDFAANPDSDIFYDKQHEVTEEVPGDGVTLDEHRAALTAWASDGHAMAWANALVMVTGGQVVRYEAHPGAPGTAPGIREIEASIHKPVEDGVYCYRCRVTPRGADPQSGLAAFGYTSPYFIQQRDGHRLLNLTATNDPRMRGAALAYERGVRVAMTRVEHVTAERGEEQAMEDKELMARAGCMESDSPAASIEKMAKYIRKMEDEGKAKEEEAKKAEMKRSALEGEVAEMRRKMEAGENPFAKKDKGDKGEMENGGDEDKDKKSEMQAMQRLSEQVRALSDGLRTERAAREALEAKQAEQATVAMERQRRDAQRDADAWAEEALVRGRWNPLHAGGNDTEQDPVRRIAMTRSWLASRRLSDPKADELLLAPGTFQPDERVAMTRLTEAGTGQGAPDPRGAGVHPAEVWAQKIDEARRTDPKLSFEAAERVAMQRHPAAYAAYTKNPTMARA